MEEIVVNNSYVLQLPEETKSSSKAFIEANTIECSLDELSQEHIIPVFIKDNEPTISQYDFISSAYQVASEIYSSEEILPPSIRVSHPVKGRVPEAKDKPAIKLLDSEKTLYYERMAFVIEIPSVADVVDENPLSLTIGGVKAYNQDNLYNRIGADQHFKIFIGFKNTVCTNLCVWTDGAMLDMKVKNIGQLKACIRSLIESYNSSYQLHHMKEFSEYFITEHQFAQLVGRCRMYNHLPKSEKLEIPHLLFGDQQVSSVVKDFYRDNSFCKMPDGTINLWRLYNLFTNANKSSYLDSFIERSVNAFDFTYKIKQAIQTREYSWYLS